MLELHHTHFSCLRQRHTIVDETTIAGIAVAVVDETTIAGIAGVL